MRTAILVGITLFMFALPLRVSAQHDHQGQPPASEQEARQRTAILQEGVEIEKLVEEISAHFQEMQGIEDPAALKAEMKKHWEMMQQLRSMMAGHYGTMSRQVKDCRKSGSRSSHHGMRH
ncbi:MAG TPA: hypothetical protein VIH17_02030 [Candidatus Acidoferrales bacterium]